MKKAVLLLVAVFAFSFANAQGFRIGVKGGGNYSSLAGKDKNQAGIYIKDNVYFGDAKNKWGYHFGLTSLYEIDDFIGIKIDALYTTKGFQVEDKITNSAGSIETQIKRSLNYISVPVLLNINAGPLFFEFGPEVAYLVNSTSEVKVKVKDPNGDKFGDGDKDENIAAKKDLNGFDFGYVAGVGLMTDAGIGLGLRYNGGINKIYNKEEDALKDQQPKIRNSNFTLSVFYMLGSRN